MLKILYPHDVLIVPIGGSQAASMLCHQYILPVWCTSRACAMRMYI